MGLGDSVLEEPRPVGVLVFDDREVGVDSLESARGSSDFLLESTIVRRVGRIVFCDVVVFFASGTRERADDHTRYRRLGSGGSGVFDVLELVAR